MAFLVRSRLQETARQERKKSDQAKSNISEKAEHPITTDAGSFSNEIPDMHTPTAGSNAIYVFALP
jgi:hypothetical protein